MPIIIPFQMGTFMLQAFLLAFYNSSLKKYVYFKIMYLCVGMYK